MYGTQSVFCITAQYSAWNLIFPIHFSDTWQFCYHSWLPFVIRRNNANIVHLFVTIMRHNLIADLDLLHKAYDLTYGNLDAAIRSDWIGVFVERYKARLRNGFIYIAKILSTLSATTFFWIKSSAYALSFPARTNQISLMVNSYPFYSH